MCCGVNDAEAAVYHIPKDAVQSFRYLNTSGCTAIPGVDDAADFQEVRQAMLAVNIDAAAQVRSLFIVEALVCPQKESRVCMLFIAYVFNLLLDSMTLGQRNKLFPVELNAKGVKQ
jgi:hypothetical protein